MPEPTPEDLDALRAELAGLRVTDPMPPEVVARLEASLARLRAEEAVVRPLAPARDRRWLGALVGAAAAVAALVGVGQVLDHTGSGPAVESSAGDQAPLADGQNQAGGPAGPAKRAQGGAPGSAYSFSSQSLPPQVARARLQSSPLATCATGYRGRSPQYAATLDGRPATILFQTLADGSVRARLYLCGGDRPVRVVRLPGG